MQKNLITKANIIDIQEHFQCSGYACAYILRYFDLKITEKECYNKMPNKMNTGYVYPKGIVNFFKNSNFKAKYIRGNLNSLKRDLEEGVPIIVMIKVKTGENWLHYVPLIGFDENNLYFAESLEYLINNHHKHYNRKISYSDFFKLWNTSSIRQPFYKYTYFIISKT